MVHFNWKEPSRGFAGLCSEVAAARYEKSILRHLQLCVPISGRLAVITTLWVFWQLLAVFFLLHVTAITSSGILIEYGRNFLWLRGSRTKKLRGLNAQWTITQDHLPLSHTVLTNQGHSWPHFRFKVMGVGIGVNRSRLMPAWVMKEEALQVLPNLRIP